jgi:preprotein translocase subunit SecF
MDVQKISSFYDKNYKKILILPIVILLISLSYIGYFYSQNNDFLHRDLSLTGGTSITVFSNISSSIVQKDLINKIPDLETRYLLDLSGNQNQIVLMTTQTPEEVLPILEAYFGYKLDSTNSSVEFTGSALSENFYKQLGITILIAFFWMAGLVFVIFSKGWKIKTWAIVLNFLFGLFLGKLFFTISNIAISFIILVAFIVVLISIYIRYSIPSFAVMFCAFADIIMTLAVADFLNMRIAGAGIVAFLMLIGYSVDTDILLTTRVMTRKENSVNREIFGSFKTGMTMTLTAITSIIVAWFIVRPFGTVLNQMFEILLIGLCFDMLNTWITNTSLIKWFVEHKSTNQHETHL